MTNNTDNALVNIWTEDRKALIAEYRTTDRDDTNRLATLKSEIDDLARRISEIENWLGQK
jgi:hypothetical protein